LIPGGFRRGQGISVLETQGEAFVFVCYIRFGFLDVRFFFFFTACKELCSYLFLKSLLFKSILK
jgi:hypothetical protein